MQILIVKGFALTILPQTILRGASLVSRPPPAGASANRNARAGRAVRPRKPRPLPECPPIAARCAARRAELVLRLTAFRCLQRAVHP